MNNTNFIPLDKKLITNDNYYDICNPYGKLGSYGLDEETIKINYIIF